MRIFIQQKELREIYNRCDTDCDGCPYCRVCAILDAAGATVKSADNWGKKDIKSIAEYLKSERYE